MNKQTKIIGAALGLALVMGSTVAVAESQYGYASSGVGPVTAQANVKLKVTVPLLILLRVGAAGPISTGDDIAWTAGFSIGATPTIPANGVNQAVAWDGAAPTATVTSSPSPASLAAYAWTNSSGGGQVSCAAPIWSPLTGGPVNTDIGVSPTGTALLHPGANLGCAAPANFTKNSLSTSTWTYSLSGTATNWSAGTYTTTLTYTATTL